MPAGEADACLEIAVSIPVNALKDDELLHYAALDPDAATELARRIADNSIDPSADREELREDVRMLESRAEDTEDQINELHSGMATAYGNGRTTRMNPI